MSVEDLFYSSDEAEPNEEPAEESVDETPEDAETEEEEVETEESEEESSDEGEDESDTIEVYEINGKEYTAEKIQELEDSGFREADYTRKTQALAEERKSFETERTALETEKANISDLSAQLEVLVAEDEEVNWDELKEDDPEEYIAKKELADKRKAKLADVKSKVSNDANALTPDQLKEESNKLFGDNPQWIDKSGSEPKLTQAYTDDMNMVSEYASKVGYSKEDLEKITSAAHWKTLIDAAKFSKQKGKASALKKKVIKKPKISKSKANKSTKKTAEELFYG